MDQKNKNKKTRETMSWKKTRINNSERRVQNAITQESIINRKKRTPHHRQTYSESPIQMHAIHAWCTTACTMHQPSTACMMHKTHGRIRSIRENQCKSVHVSVRWTVYAPPWNYFFVGAISFVPSQKWQIGLSPALTVQKQNKKRKLNQYQYPREAKI